MKDLEKRVSIIEERLGIVNLENQFEKKEGKWYKASYKSKYLVYAEKLSGHDVLKGYGFCDSGNWNVFTGSYASVLKTVEATSQEVEEALVREANRRYKVGDKVECLVSRITSIITEPPYVSTSYSVNSETDCLVSEYGCLFQNGLWAEVIEQPTDKFDLHVGLKFTAPKDDIIYEITDIYFDTVKIGWKGFKDRVDYEVSKVKEYFNDGTWKVYEPKQQQPSLEQDIQQLKDKHKQYKFTITIEDNI